MAEGLNERIEKISNEIGDLNAQLKEQIDSMINICGTVKALAEQVRDAAGKANTDRPLPPHPRWMPKEDELYYTILGYGEICGWLHHNNDDNNGAIWRSSIGNVFRTEAEAEFVVERMKILAEMNEWAGRYNDSWHIYYSSAWQRLDVTQSVAPNLLLGELRFATKEDAENCIMAVGEDRIKKYFMIPEEYIDDE